MTCRYIRPELLANDNERDIAANKGRLPLGHQLYNYDGDKYAQPVVLPERRNHFEELRASILANERAGTLTNDEIQQLRDMLTPTIAVMRPARVPQAALEPELPPLISEERVNISRETIQPIPHSDASTVEMRDTGYSCTAFSQDSTETVPTFDNSDRTTNGDASNYSVGLLAEPSNTAHNITATQLAQQRTDMNMGNIAEASNGVQRSEDAM